MSYIRTANVNDDDIRPINEQRQNGFKNRHFSKKLNIPKFENPYLKNLKDEKALIALVTPTKKQTQRALLAPLSPLSISRNNGDLKALLAPISPSSMKRDNADL